MEPRRDADELGVYVHVPFCSHRCDYCAFATWTDRGHLMGAYVSACLAEMERAYCEGLAQASTVFVGGGTPSLLPPALLAELVAGVRRQPDAEVTVECNPESTSRELLERLRDVGVNRISLGVQSLVPHVLDGLGRRQVPGAVARAVELIGEVGFPTFNVDLVYGGAGETDEDWRATLDAVLHLDPAPPHVSAYALTVEAGTPLARDRARHPDDDVQADRYVMADEVLAAAGLSWYELSNFARPGHSCRHNLACWRQADFRGFGCAAHSHAAGRRSWNIRSIDRYVAAVANGSCPTAGEEVLSRERQALERLELALRTSDGVPAECLPATPEMDGLVERRGDVLVLTRRGRLLANEVTLRLSVPGTTLAHLG
ncbi:MAG: hemN [Acidimicrobiaceae bacterium]|nr:hemN [Acidimicrobiaceae bacterium]